MSIGRSAGRLALLGLVCGVVAAAMTFPVVGGAGVLVNRFSGSVVGGSADLVAGVTPAVTTVTDSAGTPIAHLYDQYRLPGAGASTASAAMKAAIVAVEDRRFYDHGGVDPLGTTRALLNDVGGGATQGGSTLTQQYVKNYELYVAATSDAERRAAVEPSIARKVTEAELAERLDHQLSKDEILDRYLDIVYFGHGAYGVGAAAQIYFGTTPDRLTVAQAALLAGMVQSPTGDDPVLHPDAARARRGVVLTAMHDVGSITDAQVAAATAEPLGVQPAAAAPAAGCTAAGDDGYFCAYAVAYLERSGLTAQQLNSGGYTIRTTLDPAAMQRLKSSVDAQAPPATPHVADVATLVRPGADQHEVVAMAANRPYGNKPGESAYGLPFEPENLGAGSVYKIFTAAAALERGVVGIDSILDVPPSGATLPNYTDGNGRPIPLRNAGDYPAQLSLTDALAQSPNTAFVELEGRIGVPAVVDMAERLGLTSLATEPADDSAGSPSVGAVAAAQRQGSFTLGVSPTSDVELANVGATLASHGTWCPPTPIAAVTDRTGAAVPLAETPCRQAVDPGLADTLMTGLSRDDAPGGTSAAAATADGWDRPIAAKTGTTQRYESAAFLGSTPQLAGASIVFDDSASPRPICAGSPPYTCADGTIYGGTAPARTVYRAMGDVLAGQPVAALPPLDPRYLDPSSSG